MSAYARPAVEPMTFRDETGSIIDYGHRWARFDGPPEDSYSVVGHPERFAPLHAVAEALIEHLVADRDVDVDEGTDLLAELAHPLLPEGVSRVVRLTPRDPRCAPLTMVFTDFPGVHVHAGVLFENAYPSCGCDACDETWESGADDLEHQVLGVVDGCFTEEVSPPRRAQWSFDHGRGLVKGMGQTVSYAFEYPDGSESGQSRAEDVSADMLAGAVARLDELRALGIEGAWLPWPKRAHSAPDQ